MSALFDRAGMLENLGGDLELAREVAAAYLGDYRGNIATLRAALAALDGAALYASAHRMRSMVLNFGASAAAEAAVAVENLAGVGNWPAAGAAVERLIDLCEALAGELRALD